MEVYAECQNEKMYKIKNTDREKEIELSESESEVKVGENNQCVTSLPSTIILETESESEEINIQKIRHYKALTVIPETESESEERKPTETEQNTELVSPIGTLKGEYKNKSVKKLLIKTKPKVKKMNKKLTSSTKRKRCSNKKKISNDKKSSDVYYNVERVIKKRLDMVLVKWEGWSDDFNSWVHKSDIKSI